MKAPFSLALLLHMALGLGCGDPHAVPPAALPPAAMCPSASGGAQPFLSPLKLGHYTTLDGLVSFVLDRTSEPPRLQFEGDGAIYQLTRDDLRTSSNGYIGIIYLTPSGKEVIRVSKDGQIELKRGTDLVPAVRDGDARPLGSPTVTGVFRPKEDPSVVMARTLAERAIVKQNAGVSDPDSYRLEVVERILAEAPAEAFLVLADDDVDLRLQPSPEVLESHLWQSLAPSVGLGIAWSPAATGLGKFGIIARAQTHPWGLIQLGVFRLDGYPPNRQPKGPGVLWSVDASAAIFVTVDGGRYRVPLRQLEPAGGLRTALFRQASLASEAWPAQVEHVHLDELALRHRVKLGELDAALLGPIDAAQAGWLACTKRRWAAVPQLQSHEDYGAGSQKEKRQLDDLIWKLRPGIVEGCRRHVTAYESAVLKALEALIAKRQAMLDRLRERRATQRQPGGVTRPRDLSPE